METNIKIQCKRLTSWDSNWNLTWLLKQVLILTATSFEKDHQLMLQVSWYGCNRRQMTKLNWFSENLSRSFTKLWSIRKWQQLCVSIYHKEQVQCLLFSWCQMALQSFNRDTTSSIFNDIQGTCWTGSRKSGEQVIHHFIENFQVGDPATMAQRCTKSYLWMPNHSTEYSKLLRDWLLLNTCDAE